MPFSFFNFQKRFYRHHVAFFLFLLTSCQGVDTPPVRQERPAIPIETPAGPSPVCAPDSVGCTLTAEVVALPKPNQYLVRLGWNASEPPSLWVLYRAEGEESARTTPLSTLKSGAISFEDSEVEAGQTYTYFLSRIDGGDYRLFGRTKLTLPSDLEISKTAARSRIVGYHRLFLGRGAKLITASASVTIDVDELISDGAEIESFPKGAKAFSGYDGRAGGSLKLLAKKATGHLRIALNGEAGGDGLDGQPGQNGPLGPPGQAGRWEMNPILYRYMSPSFIDSFRRDMERRNPPPESGEWNYLFGGAHRYVCAVPPTSGGAGSDGTNGGDGGDGGNGGSAGSLDLEIADGKDFVLDFHAEPGLSGLGGRGGKGGDPGPGGPPGELDQGHLCPAAQSGPPGRAGLSGHQGRPGASGEKRPFCIRIGTHEEGQCPTKK